ncbi:hypothetical protein GS883_17450 [Rhodococcus hoagii]|nr:hypothetical protein [Prescottella equi]
MPSTSAAPPTVRTTGHSTSPTAPAAAIVSTAAGVEWLPRSRPRRVPPATPPTAPRTPPTRPPTAAPPSAPMDDVVTSAMPETARTAPPVKDIDPLPDP